MFKYFSLLLLSIILVYLIGNLIFQLFFKFEANKSSKLFFKLSFGFIFYTLFFSLLKTNLISINFVFVVLLLFFWFSNESKIYKRNLKFFELNEIKEILKFIPIIIFFFAWRYMTLFDDGHFPVVINMDSLKHVIRAGFLTKTGVESVNVNYLLPPKGVDPYHYFEAWSIGFWGSLFNMKFWVAQQLIVVPLISTIITMGFWGIVSRWNNHYLYLLISFPIVFITGIYISDLETIKYLKYTDGFIINAYDEWKGFSVSFAYLIIMIFLNLLVSKVDKQKAILTLLFLPIISINIAPTILTIITLLFFTLYLLRARIGFVIEQKTMFAPFLVAGFVFLFYKVFEPNVSYIDKPGLETILKDPFTPSFFKTRTIIVVEKLFQGIFFYSPYILILGVILINNLNNFKAKLKTDNYRVLILILLIGIPISTLIWQLLFNSFGSSQFLFYTMMPFTNIVSALLLFYAIMQMNNAKYLFIGAYIILTTFFIYRSHVIYADGKNKHHDKYSKEYISQVLVEVGKLDVKYGLKIEDKNQFVKFNDTHHLVGEFLPGHFNDVFMFSYTKANMFLNTDFPSKEAEMLLPKAPLTCLLIDLESKNLVEVILQLIEEDKIRFIIVQHGQSLPKQIRPYISDSIVDEKSGEIFHNINNTLREF
jgi:hypothetical protein